MSASVVSLLLSSLCTADGNPSHDFGISTTPKSKSPPRIEAAKQVLDVRKYIARFDPRKDDLLSYFLRVVSLGKWEYTTHLHALVEFAYQQMQISMPSLRIYKQLLRLLAYIRAYRKFINDTNDNLGSRGLNFSPMLGAHSERVRMTGFVLKWFDEYVSKQLLNDSKRGHPLFFPLLGLESGNPLKRTDYYHVLIDANPYHNVAELDHYSE